jgi:hypothetical protein
MIEANYDVFSEALVNKTVLEKGEFNIFSACQNFLNNFQLLQLSISIISFFLIVDLMAKHS